MVATMAAHEMLDVGMESVTWATVEPYGSG